MSQFDRRFPYNLFSRDEIEFMATFYQVITSLITWKARDPLQQPIMGPDHNACNL